MLFAQYLSNLANMTSILRTLSCTLRPLLNYLEVSKAIQRLKEDLASMFCVLFDGNLCFLVDDSYPRVCWKID